MARLSVSMLGSMRVLVDGAPVALDMPDKVRALLAYLMIEMDHPHRRHVLAGMLWPERPDGQARGSLRRALHALRAAISDRDAGNPHLLTHADSIQFSRESDYWLDVQSFSEQAQDAQSAPALEEAASLYQGSFLADMAIGDSAEFEDWATLTRERLRQQAMGVFGLLVGRLAELQDYARACVYARRQVELEPWQEQSHRQLMRLLALSGNRAAALVQYQTCCRTLKEELGIEPEAETVALFRRIRDEGQVTPKARRNHLSHLLAPMTPLVGRSKEIDEIVQLLGKPGCRLLSLVGPGGSGKTRLAMEAASRAAHAFERGAHFVPLAALESASAIVPGIAQTLGLALQSSDAVEATQAAPRSTKEQLLDYLCDKEMLLVLDNYEHLLDGAGAVVEILSAAPRVKALVTSRTRLNVPGEHLYHVAGLRYPDPGGRPADATVALSDHDDDAQSAVDLFVQTGRQLQPHWSPDLTGLSAAARICHLVDGLPLGIILAASWIEMLSPAEIARQIELQSVDFLDADWRGVPEQQRSMRAVFDHSWSLLPDRLQSVLSSLGVFRGTVDADGALAVAGATLRDMARLVDRSLVHRQAEGRFGMHALLQQYALGRLGEGEQADAARDRHAALLAGRMQAWSGELKGARQQTAMAEMTADLENGLAAWQWAIQRRRLDWLASMATAMGLYHDYRGLCEEGKRVFAQATEALEEPGPEEGTRSDDELRLLARLLAWRGVLARQAGDVETGKQVVERSLELLNTCEQAGLDVRAERAHALWCEWRVRWRLGRSEVMDFLQEQLDLCQELDDPWATAWAWYCLALVAFGAGEQERALHCSGQSLAIRREMGDLRGIADSLLLAMQTRTYLGNMEEAEALARECIAFNRELGDLSTMAHVLHWLSYIVAPLGRAEEQYALLQEVAELQKERGTRDLRVLHDLSLANLHLGRYEQAREAACSYLSQAEQRHMTVPRLNARLVLGCVSTIEGDHAAAEGWLDVDFETECQLTDLATAVQPRQILVAALRGQGKHDQAWVEFRLNVQRSAQWPVFWVHLTTLGCATMLVADRGQAERAVELHALMMANPFAASSRFFHDLFDSPVEAAATTLPPEVVAAARERGRRRDLAGTVRELAAEFGAAEA